MINVWLALRGATHNLIQAALLHGIGQEDPPPYNGPVAARHINLMRTFADWTVVQAMFKKKGAGATGYTLYSVHVEDMAEIEDLQATYPGSQVIVLGAWLYETGERVAPLHADILDYMPDIVEYDEDGNETSRTPATIPADVNLLAGQAMRDFS